MYKARFKNWGVEKYLTTRDADAIAKVTSQRDAAGKPSEFWKHGRRIDLVRFQQRYNKKKANEAAAGSTATSASRSKLSSPSASSLSPPSSAKSAIFPTNSDADSEPTEEILERGIIRVATPPPPAPILFTPAGVAVSEEMLWSLRWYIDQNATSTHQSQVLVAHQQQATDKTVAFIEAFIAGYDSFYRGKDHYQARRLLNIAFTQLKPTLLEGNNILLISRLLKIAIPEIVQQDNVQLAQMLCRYAFQLSNIVLGPTHPLPRILYLMASQVVRADFPGAGPPGRERNGEAKRPGGAVLQMPAILQFLADNLERQAGGRVTKDAVLVLLDKSYIEAMARDHVAAETTLVRLLGRLTTSFPDPNERAESELRVRRHIAWNHNVAGRSAESAQMYIDMLADEALRPHIGYLFWNNLGMVLDRMRWRFGLERADVSCFDAYRRALELSDASDGRQSSASLANGCDLQRAYERYGMVEEARAVSADMASRIEGLEQDDEAALVVDGL